MRYSQVSPRDPRPAASQPLNPASNSSATDATSGTPQGAPLPAGATPLDPSRASHSGTARTLPAANTLVSQRKSLDDLLTQLKTLRQPDRLTFQNLKSAMAQVRKHQDTLQLSARQQDSLTNKKLADIQTELLAVVVLVSGSLEQIAWPPSVEDVKTVFDGLGALIIEAKTTVFERKRENAQALDCLQAIHNRLLDHLPQLDLKSARPSAVLSIVNGICRGWKINTVNREDARAYLLFASLPGIATGWKEEDLTLKDLGKCFVLLSAAIMFAGIEPLSTEGKALRAIFNQLCNYLGKLSGHQGMTEVHDKTAGVCIGNIYRAFSNFIQCGYFDPAKMVALDLLRAQLAFIKQADDRGTSLPQPYARAAARLAMAQMEKWTPSQKANAATEDDAEPEDSVSSSSDEDSAMSRTTTTSSTTPITTTTTVTTTTATAPVTTTATTTTTLTPKVDARGQERRLAALRASTPKTIIATVHKNGRFDTLFEGINDADDSGLSVLFGEGKVKELEALVGFKPFLQAIWDTERARFGEAIVALTGAVTPSGGMGMHKKWLGELQKTFDPTDPIHEQIGALIQRINTVQEAADAPTSAVPTLRRRPHQQSASTTEASGTQQSSSTTEASGTLPTLLLPLQAGALKQLLLTKRDDLNTFFERTVAAYGDDHEDFVPKEIQDLEIPLNRPGADGQRQIKVADLIQRYRDASADSKAQLQASLAAELERYGSSGRLQTADRPLTVRDASASGRAPLSSKPFSKPKVLEHLASSPPQDLRASEKPAIHRQGVAAKTRSEGPRSVLSQAVWFAAHGVFGMVLGLYLFRIYGRPASATDALTLNPTPPGHVTEARKALAVTQEAIRLPEQPSDALRMLKVAEAISLGYIQILRFTASLTSTAGVRDKTAWEDRQKVFDEVEQTMQTILLVGALAVCAIAFIEFIEQRRR